VCRAGLYGLPGHGWQIIGKLVKYGRFNFKSLNMSLIELKQNCKITSLLCLVVSIEISVFFFLLKIPTSYLNSRLESVCILAKLNYVFDLSLISIDGVDQQANLKCKYFIIIYVCVLFFYRSANSNKSNVPTITHINRYLTKLKLKMIDYFTLSIFSNESF
jgi:hypothetical protein